MLPLPRTPRISDPSSSFCFDLHLASCLTAVAASPGHRPRDLLTRNPVERTAGRPCAPASALCAALACGLLPEAAAAPLAHQGALYIWTAMYVQHVLSNSSPCRLSTAPQTRFVRKILRCRWAPGLVAARTRFHCPGNTCSDRFRRRRRGRGGFNTPSRRAVRHGGGIVVDPACSLESCCLRCRRGRIRWFLGDEPLFRVPASSTPHPISRSMSWSSPAGLSGPRCCVCSGRCADACSHHPFGAGHRSPRRVGSPARSLSDGAGYGSIDSALSKPVWLRLLIPAA